MSQPDDTQISISELPADGVLLDVREDDEWVAGHAPNAVHVPMTQLAERLDHIPEADTVYVICRPVAAGHAISQCQRLDRGQRGRGHVRLGGARPAAGGRDRRAPRSDLRRRLEYAVLSTQS